MFLKTIQVKMFKLLFVLVVVFSAITAEKVVPFVVGGTEAVWGAYPAAVIFDTPLQFCGGSIVDQSHFITSADCVLNEDFQIIHPRWFNVIAGDIFFSPSSASRVNRNVSNIFVHPEYNPFSGEHNLAIIRVTPAFPHPHNFLEPAIRQTRIIPHFEPCFLAAWGRQTVTATIFRSRQIQVSQPILSFDVCAAVTTPHANRITDNMICGQTSPTQAPCGGNLGSGLYCNGELTGVLTSGIACGAANTPAVYQQIRVYNDWIDKQFKRTDDVIPGSTPFVTRGFPVRVPRY